MSEVSPRISQHEVGDHSLMTTRYDQTWHYLPLQAVAHGTIWAIRPRLDACSAFLPDAADRAAYSYERLPQPQPPNAPRYVLGNVPRKEGPNVEYLPHIRTEDIEPGYRTSQYDENSLYPYAPTYSQASDVSDMESMLASASEPCYESPDASTHRCKATCC